MALGNQLILAGFAVAAGAFVTVLFFYFRLRHYVSKDKLHAVEDVSQLWKYGVPPKIALNEKGLRQHRYGKVSLVILLIAAGITAIMATFRLPSPPIILPAILYGSFLATAFFDSRLIHHVSRENVRSVEDVSRLWIIGVPPKIVLNEKGLRLYRFTRVAAAMFFTGIGTVFLGIIVYGIPVPQEMWLGAFP